MKGGILWQKTCDVALVNTPLGKSSTEIVLPPGPARSAEAKQETANKPFKKLFAQGGLLSLSIVPDRCVVWLDEGPRDLAYISLPASMAYPLPEAGAVLFDGKLSDEINKQALVPGETQKRLPVEIFGYGTPLGQTEAPRGGRMHARTDALVDQDELAAGYVPMMPSTDPVQYLFSGDSGGPTLLAATAGAAFLQVGVNSHGTTPKNANGVTYPSAIIPPSASMGTLLLRWFEHPKQFRHTPTITTALLDTESPHFLDWDGDTRIDLVAIGPSAARIWRGTETGFAAPFTRTYAFGDEGASVEIEPEHALPTRLVDTLGKAAPALIVGEEGMLRVYRDDGTRLIAKTEQALPSGVGKARTPDNMRVVRVSQTTHDELLLIDADRFTVLRGAAWGLFDVSAPATTKLVFGSNYGNDFTLADVDGDQRTDFIHRAVEEIVVLRGQADGTFFGGTPSTMFASPLPTTRGIRFYDLNGDKRDDLVWIDRQTDLSDGRRVHVRLADKEKPGTFLVERIFPLEVGDAWITSTETGSVVSGYDIGDVTGDGVPDLVHAGSVGVQTNSGTLNRLPALLLKPGNGDGSFAEMRVWQMVPEKLGVKENLGASLYVHAVTSKTRADVVFADIQHLDLVVAP